MGLYVHVLDQKHNCRVERAQESVMQDNRKKEKKREEELPLSEVSSRIKELLLPHHFGHLPAG